MKINLQTDCGNSPKREFIKELTVLFASYQFEEVMKHLEEDVSWTLKGESPIEGREDFKQILIQHSKVKVAELTIHSVLSHGKEAAVNGEMLMENGELMYFADFYTFKSAKGNSVQSIVSYVIPKR